MMVAFCEFYEQMGFQKYLSVTVRRRWMKNEQTSK